MKLLKLWYLRWQLQNLKAMVVKKSMLQSVARKVNAIEKLIYSLQMKKAA